MQILFHKTTLMLLNHESSIRIQALLQTARMGMSVNYKVILLRSQPLECLFNTLVKMVILSATNILNCVYVLYWS